MLKISREVKISTNRNAGGRPFGRAVGHWSSGSALALGGLGSESCTQLLWLSALRFSSICSRMRFSPSDPLRHRGRSPAVSCPASPQGSRCSPSCVSGVLPVGWGPSCPCTPDTNSLPAQMGENLTM